jgi:hypothetical protein
MNDILSKFTLIFMFICIIILFIQNKNFSNKINNIENFKNGDIESFDQSDCAELENSNCWESDGNWCSNPNFTKSALGAWQCANCSICKARGGTAGTAPSVPVLPPPKNTDMNKINEKMDEMIDEKIKRQYNMDIEAIRNLGTISKSLLTGKNYHNTVVTPGELKIPANVQTLGNQYINGNQNVQGTLSVGGHELLPAGSVIIWTKKDIPAGWVICDGKTYNGVKTPNLNNRFVYGTTNQGLINRTGGEALVRLNTNQMPSHTHSGVTVTKGGNSGTGRVLAVGDGNSFGTYTPQVNSTGGGQAHNNMPPYYVLIYIMKVY